MGNKVNCTGCDCRSMGTDNCTGNSCIYLQYVIMYASEKLMIITYRYNDNRIMYR